MEIYESGKKDKSEIIEELRKRGRTFKNTTIGHYLSIIKSSRQMDSNDSSSSTDIVSHNSINDNDRHVQEQDSKVALETQEEPTPQIQTETGNENIQGLAETTEKQVELPKETFRSPVQSDQIIRAENKFSLEGIKADLQPESEIMSKSYMDDYKPIADPNKKLIPVKLFRIGAFNGDLTAAVMSTDKIKKATNGYEMAQKEIDMINEDTKEILENRLKLIDSEFGDFINLGLGYATLFFKTIVHKIKNPQVKEIIEDEIKEAEDKIVNEIESAKKQLKTESGEIIEVDSIDKVKEENLLCQNCSLKKIFKHSMCKDCYFKAEILKGQDEFNK